MLLFWVDICATSEKSISRNVARTKYTSDNVKCQIQLLCNDSNLSHTFKESFHHLESPAF